MFFTVLIGRNLTDIDTNKIEENNSIYKMSLHHCIGPCNNRTQL
jgi:hypothetical protein